MATADGERGFLAFYRVYARSGVHAASAAALTALIGLGSFTGIRWFVPVGIAVYALPPVALYLTGEAERVPSVTNEESTDEDGGPGREGDSTPPTDAADPETPDSDVEPTGATATEDTGAEAGSGWHAVDTPTDESLLDVVSTSGGAVAVGEGGAVLARDGEGWEAALEDGPTATANPLRGVDATAEGGAVWFAGDGGVLGRDADGRLTDHSAPRDRTGTWTDIAVTGAAGEERLHLVNGSGELLRGRYEDGRVSWDEVVKPGSGSSISAVSFAVDDHGHLCDTNQGVYRTTDGGDGYERIGVEDANAAFTGVSAVESTVAVACDDGSILRYDGAVWTRFRAAETALSAVDLGESGLAAGDAGTVVELAGGRWEERETPTDADLSGVAVGSADGPDVAVGADGTIIERDRERASG